VAAAAAVAIATAGTAADGVSRLDSTTWPPGQDFSYFSAVERPLTPLRMKSISEERDPI